LREIISTRTRRRRELREKVRDRTRTVDALLEARRYTAQTEIAPPPETPEPVHKLKRYQTD
jgi:hypothetical protein